MDFSLSKMRRGSERRLLAFVLVLLLLPFLRPGCWTAREDLTVRIASRFAGNAAAPQTVVVAIDDRSHVGQ